MFFFIIDQASLPGLEFLNLSNNSITSLHSQPINGHHKLKVILDNNPLECDCNIYNFIISGSFSLKIENLTCAGPKNLQGEKISDLKSSNLICLRERKVTSSMCPENCECLAIPESRSFRIKCGANVDFYQFPNISKGLFNETELKIENASLKMLPNRTFSWYNEVTSLIVSGNKISAIGEMNIPLFIKNLELNQNKLSTLDPSLFAKNLKLEKLKLSGNPWNCNCENFEFIFSALNRKKLITDFKQMQCADGRLFNELEKEDICWKITTAVFAISCISALTGLVLGTIAALFYKYEKQIKMWLYSHNFCLPFVTEAELDKVCSKLLAAKKN